MPLVSRREFTASLLAAGTSLAAGRAARGLLNANDLIRVGIIGCRNRGPQVAETFVASKRFEIAALCDCDQAMLDKGMSALSKRLVNRPRLERDFRTLLDDRGIDAVVVASPDHWHALMTVMALDAGKHVYVEKPASYNVLDGRNMVAARQKHEKLAVLVGTQHRSGRHFADARQFIAEGGLGKVGFARAWFSTVRQLVPIMPDSKPPAGFDYDLWVGPAPMRPFNEAKVHYNWHFMRDYGTGDMGNWGAHWLDSLRHLLDLDVPRSVTAVGGTFVVRDGKETPDTQTVIFEYPELTMLWELREWCPRPVNGMESGIEISGDKATLILDRGGWTVHPRDGAPVKHKGSAQELEHALNFADCIAGQAKPAAAIEEGHKTCILIHLGNLATQLGRRLEWDAAGETVRGDAEAARLLGREYRPTWRMPAI